MSTKTLLDDIAPQVREGYSRSTGTRSLLALIQKGQDKLFRYDGPQFRYLGTDNLGWVPYIKTVAGVFEYEIVAANLNNVTSLVRVINGVSYPIRARTVLDVFVDSTNIDYGKRWIGEPYVFYWQNPYSTATSRLSVVGIPVDSYEATGLTSAKIIFKEDPGDSTDKYFIRFTIEPPRLTSESVPLIIPEYYEEAIEDYVIGTIQKRENGTVGDRWSLFHTNRPGIPSWLSRFHQELSRGAQSDNTKIQSRIC
jgi:hypothetical protein